MSITVTQPVLGNAQPDDVLAGSTFSGLNVAPGTQGTIPTQPSGQTITPGTEDITLDAGYYESPMTVAGSANLVAGNIAEGVELFGVAGASVVAAGTATASDVLDGVTFTSAQSSSTQTGTMPNNGSLSYTPSASAQTIPAGYTTGGTVEAVDVPAGDVLTGTTIAGVAGTMPNNGALNITPSTSSQSYPDGFYTSVACAAADLKQTASGSATVSFDYSGSGLGTLSVSGLGFTPRVIYALPSGSYSDIQSAIGFWSADAGVGWSINTGPALVGISPTTGSGTFSMPLYCTEYSSMTVNWWAWN